MLKKLHHAAYRCKDAQTTTEFYTNVLGLKLAAALVQDEIHSIKKHEPHTHIFFQMADGSYIAFFEILAGFDTYTPDVGDWAQHLALEVEDQATADIILARLASRGVEIVGPELHGGIIKSWYFYDPNGHRLEIVVPTGGKDVWDRLAELAPAGLDEWNARKANA